MRVGIVGSGKIGEALAGLLVGAGDEVTLANSRGPQSLADRVAGLGPAARAGTIDEAARRATSWSSRSRWASAGFERPSRARPASADRELNAGWAPAGA